MTIDKKIRIRLDAKDALVNAQKIEDAIKGIGGATDGLNTKIKPSVDGVRGALAGMGRSAGQASIQVQQFVGQLQGGVKPSIALSQQAADLGYVLGFPLLGAAVSVAAVFAGPFIDSILDADDATEKITERVDTFAESLKNLSSRSITAKTTIEINKLIQEQNKLQLTIDKNNATVKQEIELAGGLNKLTDGQVQKINTLNAETQGLTKQKNILIETQSKLFDASLDAIISTSDQATETNRLREEEKKLDDQRKASQKRAVSGLAGLTPTQALDAQLEQQRALLLQDKENKFISEMEFKERMIVLEQQFEDRKLALKQAAADKEAWILEQRRQRELFTQLATLSAYESFANSSLGLIAAFGSKSNKLQKKIAIAQTGISIAVGIAKAQELGPPLSWAEAARVAALGAQLVTQIKGSSISSASVPTATGGAGSSASFAPPIPQAAQSNQVQTLDTGELVNELRRLGSEPVPASFVARILEAIPEARQISGGG